MRTIDASLRTKIMGQGIVPIVLIALLAGVGTYSVGQLLNSIEAVDHTHKVLEIALDSETDAVDMQNGVRAFLITGDEKFLEHAKVAEEGLFAKLAGVRKIIRTASQIKVLDEAGETIKTWKAKVVAPHIAQRRASEASKAMDDARTQISRGDDDAYFSKFRELLHAFQEKERSLMKSRKGYADYVTSLTRKILVGGAILSAVLVLVIAFVFSGSLTRPLVKAIGMAEAISRGDLTKTLEVNTRDEVGRLCTALNEMVRNLRDQLGQMLEAGQVLASSAAEILATVSELATSTSQTSAAVAETSTTVEQVKQAARLASDKARDVAQMSQKAVQVSEWGGKATDATAQKMNLIKEQMESIGETVVRLSDHSRAIEDIISTVQDLADQSNLLAVNASIEAARAGEQGKGFTVVAQEIKALADQSKDSTGQIRSILNETRKWVSAVVMATEQGVKAVDAGIEQSSATWNAIGSLADSVVQSAQAASVIEATSSQQFGGVEQVANAMGSIQQAVLQNSDGAAQLEGAARRLTDLGEQFKDLASRYNV